jgi:replicative DNA helicase
MPYAIGISALYSLCEKQSTLDWQRAKLSPALFRSMELPVYTWVNAHLENNHTLPTLDTLTKVFPELTAFTTPEPPSYYIRLVENRYYHKLVKDALAKADGIIEANQDDHAGAFKAINSAYHQYTLQKYRLRVTDVGVESKSMMLAAYHNVDSTGAVAGFGWPYMDDQGGAIMPGELVSFVGRPGLGKTWLTLWTALYNWHVRKENVMFVSMEMATLAICQRIAAMYTKTPITQLKVSGFSSDTYNKFASNLNLMETEEAKFYVIDGNLAASVMDIYDLADVLGCKIVVVDGAYLLKHANPRLDRYTKVAENCELMKQITSELNTVTVCSWQLSREAEKKKKDNKVVGLEDIGMSDAIPQISSIVLGLFEEDSPETILSRRINVMKGRNGEVGELRIAWDFADMNFAQVSPALVAESETPEPVEDWIG